MGHVKVKSVLKLEVSTVTKITKNFWVPDSDNEEGGFYHDILVDLKEPMLSVNCLLESEENVYIGGIYADEKHGIYIATSAKKLTSSRRLVQSFSIPTELHLIAKGFTE